MSAIKKLVKFGFRKVGKWKLDIDGKYKYGIDFEIEELKEKVVAYSFTTSETYLEFRKFKSGKITFIERLKWYRCRAGGGRNDRINKELKKALDRGEDVFIYVILPSK